MRRKYADFRSAVYSIGLDSASRDNRTPVRLLSISRLGIVVTQVLEIDQKTPLFSKFHNGIEFDNNRDQTVATFAGQAARIPASEDCLRTLRRVTLVHCVKSPIDETQRIGLSYGHGQEADRQGHVRTWQTNIEGKSESRKGKRQAWRQTANEGETMTDSQEELWEIIHTLDERVAELERLLAIGREKIAELNTENSGWLETYRQQQSQIYELKAAISRLESRIRSQQGES